MNEDVTFKQMRLHTYDDIQTIGDIQDFIKQPLYQYLHNREENLFNYGGNLIMKSKGKNPNTGKEIVIIYFFTFTFTFNLFR